MKSHHLQTREETTNTESTYTRVDTAGFNPKQITFCRINTTILKLSIELISIHSGKS
jgi:hypothetical protein